MFIGGRYIPRSAFVYVIDEVLRVRRRRSAPCSLLPQLSRATMLEYELWGRVGDWIDHAEAWVRAADDLTILTLRGTYDFCLSAETTRNI